MTQIPRPTASGEQRPCACRCHVFVQGIEKAPERPAVAQATAGTGHLDAAVNLLEYAFHLRRYGERVPGGNETWAEWDDRAERFLRALTDITEEPTE